jgi:hypothetical protein
MPFSKGFYWKFLVCQVFCVISVFLFVIAFLNIFHRYLHIFVFNDFFFEG